jgi:hypothetical protein
VVMGGTERVEVFGRVEKSGRRESRRVTDDKPACKWKVSMAVERCREREIVSGWRVRLSGSSKR